MNIYVGFLSRCRRGLRPGNTTRARKVLPRGQIDVGPPAPARGSRTPRRGHFAEDKGEGGGCLEEASCHPTDRQQLSSRIWTLIQTGGLGPPCLPLLWAYRAGAATSSPTSLSPPRDSRRGARRDPTPALPSPQPPSNNSMQDDATSEKLTNGALGSGSSFRARLSDANAGQGAGPQPQGEMPREGLRRHRWCGPSCKRRPAKPVGSPAALLQAARQSSQP